MGEGAAAAKAGDALTTVGLSVQGREAGGDLPDHVEGDLALLQQFVHHPVDRQALHVNDVVDDFARAVDLEAVAILVEGVNADVDPA